MKKIKKLLALIMAMAMVLGMSVTAFAAGTAPSKNDQAVLTIEGIKDENAKITVYKIVEPEYNESGLVGYKVVDGYTIADKTNFHPSIEEIPGLVAAAKNPENITFTKTGDGKYTAKVGAGEYLVNVESANYTYNPMVVSVWYTDANDSTNILGGTVDASTNWSLDGVDGYAKSSEIKPEKKVDLTSQEVGKEVNYTITGTIPSYGPTYKDPVYRITDTYENLENQTEPVVTIGGIEATANVDYNYEKTTNGFYINILNLGSYTNKTVAERAVEIKYTATIAKSASVFNPATNSAEINYSNKPGTIINSAPVETYTYTFDITNQFNKTGEGDKKDALDGAEFTLYREDGSEFGKYTTTVDNGKAYIAFSGLKEGTYTMKETNAPAGYSLNDTTYTIVIKDLTYDKDESANDKQLTGYTIEVTNDKDSSVVSFVYEKQDEGFVLTNENSVGTIEVKNTKLSNLPSTGGIGTTIFTIGGCAIMIIAAGLFFASRRKSAK